MPPRHEDRVFVGARKHFRARYSVTEVRLGALLVFALGVVAAWVVWMGAHPDPALTSAGPGLVRRAPEKVDRGPLPPELAPPGWQEQKPSSYDPTNLYVKIDGREGYYKSFGFKRLHCLTLTGPGGDPIIDLELYDLGSAANALGAAAGELPQGSAAELRDGSLSLIDKNALYLARGSFYLRAIGSADTAAVREVLGRVRDRFAAALPAGQLPWSYPLFLSLGVPPSKVSYLAENAFSFGFARDVNVGLLPDGETELFAAVLPDESQARALAAQFERGFQEYGEPLGKRAGVGWFKDRYLSRASAAGSQGRLVVGVHGASDAQAGAALFTRLAAAVRALPAATDFSVAPAAGQGG
jgi:hypothetical protein